MLSVEAWVEAWVEADAARIVEIQGLILTPSCLLHTTQVDSGPGSRDRPRQHPDRRALGRGNSARFRHAPLCVCCCGIIGQQAGSGWGQQHQTEARLAAVGQEQQEQEQEQH